MPHLERPPPSANGAYLRRQHCPQRAMEHGIALLEHHHSVDERKLNLVRGTFTVLCTTWTAELVSHQGWPVQMLHQSRVSSSLGVARHCKFVGSLNASAFRLTGNRSCSVTSPVTWTPTSDARPGGKTSKTRLCKSYRITESHSIAFGLKDKETSNRALRDHVENDAVRIDMCRAVGPPTASPRTGTSVLWASTGTHWCVLTARMSWRRSASPRAAVLVLQCCDCYRVVYESGECTMVRKLQHWSKQKLHKSSESSLH